MAKADRLLAARPLTLPPLPPPWRQPPSSPPYPLYAKGVPCSHFLPSHHCAGGVALPPVAIWCVRCVCFVCMYVSIQVKIINHQSTQISMLPTDNGLPLGTCCSADLFDDPYTVPGCGHAFCRCAQALRSRPGRDGHMPAPFDAAEIQPETARGEGGL